MATLRRSVVVSVLFVVFGGPGIVLAYAPYWITRLRVPAGEPDWQKTVARRAVCREIGYCGGMGRTRATHGSV